MTQISGDDAQRAPLLLRSRCLRVSYFLFPFLLLYFFVAFPVLRLGYLLHLSFCSFLFRVRFLCPGGLQRQYDGKLAKKSSETSIWHKHNFQFVDWHFRARGCVALCICMCVWVCLCVLGTVYPAAAPRNADKSTRRLHSHCFILHVGIDTKMKLQLRLTENVAVILRRICFSFDALQCCIAWGGVS